MDTGIEVDTIGTNVDTKGTVLEIRETNAGMIGIIVSKDEKKWMLLPNKWGDKGISDIEEFIREWRPELGEKK